MAFWKLACVSTNTPFSTFGFTSASQLIYPDNANIIVVTVNGNIFSFV